MSRQQRRAAERAAQILTTQATRLQRNLNGKHLALLRYNEVRPTSMGTAPLTLPRPDLGAYRKAIAATFPEIVQALVAIIGRKLTAYIASVKDARAIDRWLQHAAPQKDVEQRIRLAYHVAAMLAEVDTAAVVQAWFIGLNPELDDAVPVTLLREGNVELDGKRILNAARAFLAGA